MTWQTSSYRQHLVLRGAAAASLDGTAAYSHSKRSDLQRWRD